MQLWLLCYLALVVIQSEQDPSVCYSLALQSITIGIDGIHDYGLNRPTLVSNLLQNSHRDPYGAAEQ